MMNPKPIHATPATSTPVLTRKRTASGIEKFPELPPRTLISTNDDDDSTIEDDGHIDLSTVASSSYLTNLPSHLRTHLGTFLSFNDISAMTQTNQQLYRERFNHTGCLKKNSVFHLVLEERLPPVKSFKNTLQPFRFLFQSPNYGTLQVDFALVNPPKVPPPLPPGTSRPTPVPNAPWQQTLVRINIQSKEPGGTPPALSTAKHILCMDQSMPWSSMYGRYCESWYVSSWGAGHLASLLQKCVLRLTQLQKEVREGEVVEYKPSPEFILTKVQATLKRNMLQHLIRITTRIIKKE